VSGNISLLVRAFLVYVRPVLEYSMVVWSPYLKQDIMKIEKVQRRFTKRLRGYRHMSYVDRLAKLGLPSLELGRLYLDLIYCYKVVFGLVKLNSIQSADLFELSTVTATRGHSYKLYKPRCTVNVRVNFFACRVVNFWNSLPDFVSFVSLYTFKRSLMDVDFSKCV